MRYLLLIAAVALVSGACGGGGEPRAEASCPPPEPVEDLSLLPRDLPLDEWGTVVEVDLEKGFLGARAVTETRIVELYPVLARSVVEGGYEILSGDNEGFEAEIVFVRRERTNGTFVLREACGDQVTIRLLYGARRYRSTS